MSTVVDSNNNSDLNNKSEGVLEDGTLVEENVKNQNEKISESETRGRKMTVVNFLPCDCKLCGEKFTSDKALGYHIRDVHVVGKKDKKEGEEGRKKKPKDYHYIRGKDWKVLNPKRPHCCSTCGKRFLYESSLNHHKVVKHNEKIATGEGDEAGGSNIPPKMYNHTFQCDQCGKILMSKHSLIRHLVSFHGTDHEKPFQCDICGQRYVSISSLVSHRRKEHTGDKPYVCEHCGKAFTMSNRLKCHLRVHSDEKFYKCQQCSKQFKSCSAFRAHKDTHLGVMRHTCKYCGRKFLFQGNMIKHIRRRHPNGEKINPDNNNNGLCSGDERNSVQPLISNSSELDNNNINSLTLENDNVLQAAAAAAVAVSSITVANSNRRTHRNAKSLQSGPDHSYFTKEVSATIASQNQLDVLEQQHQNISLSPIEQFVQPEIQFQVLPLSSLPNHELFNGLSYQQPHLNQTSTSSGLQISSTTTAVATHSNQNLVNHQRNVRQDMIPQSGTTAHHSPQTTNSGKCRLCDQAFPDIRFHIIDFHRIPLQKVESIMPTMVYF